MKMTLFFVWCYLYNRWRLARHRRYCKKYRENNPEKVQISQRKWNNNHQDYLKGRPKTRTDEHREYCAQRRKEDRNFRIVETLRNRIRQALSGGYKKGAKTKELLGCSILELRAWLEGWFEPGMTWENYGEWHVDHWRPCASFDFSIVANQKHCFHFLNLRPLWAKDNLIKGVKLLS